MKVLASLSHNYKILTNFSLNYKILTFGIMYPLIIGNAYGIGMVICICHAYIVYDVLCLIFKTACYFFGGKGFGFFNNFQSFNIFMISQKNLRENFSCHQNPSPYLPLPQPPHSKIVCNIYKLIKCHTA